ncbi:Gag-Pol polyprotein, partial [Mucuna pruriens]
MILKQICLDSNKLKIIQVRKFELDEELLQTFRKVEINIALPKAIKQIKKYAKLLKDLCTPKRNKLKGDVEMGRNVSMLIKSERVFALIQHAILKKCRDPGTFTIPCTIGECTFADAMLDLGASINVMPSSLYKSLNVGDLEPTGVIIQLENRSIVHPLGILEDVLVRINELIFPVDFYVLNMEGEPSSKGSTLMLGRPFLMTAKTKIDVHVGTFSMEFADVSDFTNLADFECTCEGGNECSICAEVVEVAASEPSPPYTMQPLALELKPLSEHLKYAYLERDQKLLRRLNPTILDVIKKGVTKLLTTRIIYPISNSQWVNPIQVVPKKFRMTMDHFALLFIDQVLERLAGYMQIYIASTDEHKTTFTCLFGTFAYTKLRPVQRPKHLSKVYDFMVYGHSFDACLESLSRVLDRCIGTNLVLNFEKCHFIPCIEAFQELQKRLTTTPILQVLDRELPFELICDASNLALLAVLGQQVGKHSYVIGYASHTLDSAQANYITTKKELLAINFDIEIRDKSGAKKLVADHLSRIERRIDPLPIRDDFPVEQLMQLDGINLWFTDIVNYLVASILPPKASRSYKNKIKSDAKYYVGIVGHTRQLGRYWIVGFIGLPFSGIPITSLPLASNAKELEWPLPTHMRCPSSLFIFVRFGVPKALISDQGSHFYNKTMSTFLEKVATTYHPQTNGQAEVFNREIKQILHKVGHPNRKYWIRLLEDALWAHRTAYRTPLGMSPYRIVFGKVCHLLVEIEHYAYWAVKRCNLAFDQASKERNLQLPELDDLRLEAYENYKIYKEKVKRFHDNMILRKEFKLIASKLHSKWDGPFVIFNVFPYGGVEIRDKVTDKTFKVNGH